MRSSSFMEGDPDHAAPPPAPDLLADRVREARADRSRYRAALLGAAAAHLLLLLAPLPDLAHDRPPSGGQDAGFELRTFRFAPPAPPPPEPVPAEPEIEEAAPDEEAPGPPGPPARTTVEILFAESELSRLVPPQPVDIAPPPIPEEARREERGGEVILVVYLDAAGEIAGVRALEGPEDLAAAALETARGWRFLPGTLDGNPIPVAVEVRIVFPGTSPRG